MTAEQGQIQREALKNRIKDATKYINEYRKNEGLPAVTEAVVAADLLLNILTTTNTAGIGLKAVVHQLTEGARDV